MMTLEQVAWKLGELAREGGCKYDAHEMSITCSQLADAVTDHLKSREAKVDEKDVYAWFVREILSLPRWHQSGGGVVCNEYGPFVLWSSIEETFQEAKDKAAGIGEHVDAKESSNHATPPGYVLVPVEPTQYVECGQVVWPAAGEKHMVTYFADGAIPEVGTKLYMRTSTNEEA